jgi:hypothetical protein
MIAFLRIVPWQTVGAVASGVGALFLLRYLYRYRDRPGVDWFQWSAMPTPSSPARSAVRTIPGRKLPSESVEWTWKSRTGESGPPTDVNGEFRAPSLPSVVRTFIRDRAARRPVT